jgi:hypothetical protein
MLHPNEISLDVETYKNLFEEAKLLGSNYLQALVEQAKRQDFSMYPDKEVESFQKNLAPIIAEATNKGIAKLIKKKN